MLGAPLSLYVHIPWCVKKCPYCDFNSHEVRKNLPEKAYIEALVLDLDQQATRVPNREIISIFIGGGTPSLFSAKSIKRLLNAVQERFKLKDSAEVSLEANPGTLDLKNFSGYRKAGVNRISVGIQSFDDAKLKTLGRIHSAQTAWNSIKAIKEAGFENFNIDLMYALPHQTLQDAASDVEIAISLNPSHISYYQLTLEPNTHFYNHPPLLPVDELTWKLQQQGVNLLSQNGYQQYEVSAFSKPGYSCLHNKNYWIFGDYIGIGAGAHQKVSDLSGGRVFRSDKPRNPQQYMNLVKSSPSHDNMHELSQDDIAFEFLMNALRLKKGFNLQQFKYHTGLQPDHLKQLINPLVDDGLLISKKDTISCSDQGYRFLDNILQTLLPNTAA